MPVDAADLLRLLLLREAGRADGAGALAESAGKTSGCNSRCWGAALPWVTLGVAEEDSEDLGEDSLRFKTGSLGGLEAAQCLR